MALFGNIENLIRKKDHIRYIDDYDTDLVEDEKGKYRKKVVYTGPMIPIMSDPKSVRARLLAVIPMVLANAAAVVYAAFMKHASVSWVLTNTLLIGVMFPSFYMIMALLHLPYSGKPMQRDGYMHGMIRMFRSAGAVMVVQIAGFVNDFFYRFYFKDWMFFPEDFLFLGLIVGSGLLAGGIVLILRSIEVDELELNRYNEIRNIKP